MGWVLLLLDVSKLWRFACAIECNASWGGMQVRRGSRSHDREDDWIGLDWTVQTCSREHQEAGKQEEQRRGAGSEQFSSFFHAPTRLKGTTTKNSATALPYVHFAEPNDLALWGSRIWAGGQWACSRVEQRH